MILNKLVLLRLTIALAII